MTRDIVAGSLAAIAKRDGLSLAESFLSVDAILVIDMSGSMAADDAPGGRTRYDAAEAELRDLQTALPGRIAVVAFSDDAQFCPSGVPPRLGQGTNMGRALAFVHPADGVARIILISDGEPNSAEEALSAARMFKYRIDTIYIGPEEHGRGRAFLERLAAATGGQSIQSAAPGLLSDATRQLLLTGAVA
jgi:Mg-chelatase subunit ChlD